MKKLKRHIDVLCWYLVKVAIHFWSNCFNTGSTPFCLCPCRLLSSTPFCLCPCRLLSSTTFFSVLAGCWVPPRFFYVLAGCWVQPFFVSVLAGCWVQPFFVCLCRLLSSTIFCLSLQAVEFNLFFVSVLAGCWVQPLFVCLYRLLSSTTFCLSLQAVEFNQPHLLLQKPHSKFKAMYDAMKVLPRGDSINEEDPCRPAQRNSMGCDDAFSWSLNGVAWMIAQLHHLCECVAKALWQRLCGKGCVAKVQGQSVLWRLNSVLCDDRRVLWAS